MKSIGLKVLVAAAVVASVGVTYANADPVTVFGGTLSADVAVQSDYRFRGISQNDKEPSEQGSLNWTGADGWYAGTWLAKINWGANDPSLEVDVYAGKHFDLGGTDLNVEAYYYTYPDANFPGTSASYYETILQLSHSFGPLALTLTGTNSPNWSLSEGTGWYVEGTAAYTLNDWLAISGNVGHQTVNGGSFALADYTHYDIGLTATWHNLVLDARYVDTDLSATNCASYMDPHFTPTSSSCNGGFVATLTYNMNQVPW